MAEPLSLGQLGRMLSRYWILVLVGTLLGGLLAFGATRFMPPVYRATAIQLVKGLPGTGAAANYYQAAQFAISRAKTYPSFVYNSTVLDGVRKDLDSADSLADLREEITVTNPVETPLLEITAAGSTAQEARDKANSAARHLSEFITEIETVGGRSPVIVETAVQAATPTSVDSPKVIVITALGVLIGFALATVIALIHSRVHDQRRAALRRKEVAELADAEPTLAVSARAGPADAGVPAVPTYPATLADPAGAATLAAAAHAALLADAAAARTAAAAAAPAAESAAAAPLSHSADDAAHSSDLGSESSWELARELAHAVTEAAESWSEWDESLFEIDPDPTTTTAAPPLAAEPVAVDKTEPAGTVESVKPVDAGKPSDSGASEQSPDTATGSETSHDNQADAPGDAAEPVHAVEVESPKANGSADLNGSIAEVATGNGLEKVSAAQQSSHR